MTIGVLIVVFVIKLPKLVEMIVTITGLSSTHCQSKVATKDPRLPSRNLVFLTFQHQTTVIYRASSKTPCFNQIYKHPKTSLFSRSEKIQT